MQKKRVYIASSWRNRHGVELLTERLRSVGYDVISWIENNFKEATGKNSSPFNFDEWMNTADSDRSFVFDVNGATTCDIFIYYGPAGMDACAELGAAFATHVNGPFPKEFLGLWAKGEGLGLMQKMISVWFDHPVELISYLEERLKCGNSRPPHTHLHHPAQ